MKTKLPVITLSTLVGIFFFLISGCEKPALKTMEKEVSRPKKVELEDSILNVNFPIERSITDNQGRNVDISIIGKDAASITFVRKSDGQRFVFSISNLSKEDQKFVTSLPDELAPEIKKEKSGYIIFREKEIDRIKEKISELQISSTGSELKKRSNYRRIEVLNEEIKKLEIQIENYSEK